MVKHIGFAHIRPLNVNLVLLSIFKMDFTAWSNLTVVGNHLVGKAILGSVVNHNRFANRGFSTIPRCFHIGSPTSDGFYRLVRFLTAVKTYLVRNPIVGLVGIYMGLGHIRPLEVGLWVFLCIIWRFSPSPRRSASAVTWFFKNCVGLPSFRSVDLWFWVNMTHIIFEIHSIPMLTIFS